MFFNKKSSLKILFVASEAAPFAKVGGLGEVMYSLPRALREMGHDARLIIPRYLSIDRDKFPTRIVEEGLEVPSGDGNPIICNIKESFEPRAGKNEAVTTYFLENEEYYEKRSNVYGYSDDPVRWALLARGTIEFIRRHQNWRPDVIVASDWQAGLIANYLRTEFNDNPLLKNIAVLFSIHNLYFQGMFDHHFVNEMDYDDGHSAIPPLYAPRLLKLNFMRRGIMYADAINTVSPTYSREITMPEHGELLHDLLSENRSRLYGILNGIDYGEWNPETDKNIEHRFSAKNIEARRENKKYLQHKFNLPENDGAFVVGIVARLTEQKGFDLLLEITEPLLRQSNLQLIVLGTGDGKYLGFFENLKNKFPEKVAIHLAFDAVLPHMIYAGADAVLIPSRYEPSGLTQMEAMRYGAIPIVRKTGGLADSVANYNPIGDDGNGFVFEEYNPFALYGAVVRALEIYQHQEIWKRIQARAMATDFSWEHSAAEYVQVIERAIDARLSANAG